MRVPETLVNGNHEEIKRWRRREALKKTLRYRPELLDEVELNKEDRKILEELRSEEEVLKDHGFSRDDNRTK